MARIIINPECWNCGNTISNSGECLKCGEQYEDKPVDDDAGEREFMRVESRNRDLTEDENLIYGL
jgi:tRNA(Ile2) C34 agmatinyltransferase TiaS